MHFLPNVFVTCEVCKGQRYNDATLRVTYKDKNIAEILDTPIEEAREMFQHHKQLGADHADAGRRRPRLPGARPAGDRRCRAARRSA